MGPHSPRLPAPDMFRSRLDEQINMKHPVVRLASGLSDRAMLASPWVSRRSSHKNAFAVLFAASKAPSDHAFRAGVAALMCLARRTPYDLIRYASFTCPFAACWRWIELLQAIPILPSI